MRRVLGISKEKTACLALNWLFYLDEHTTSGETKMHPEEIDDLFGQKNLAKALLLATWAKQETDGTLTAQDYELHNGDNTKKRLMQSIYDTRRPRKKSGTDAAPKPEKHLENPKSQSGKSQTGIWTREEKRREDNINHNSISNQPTITRSSSHYPTTRNQRQNDCNANRRYDM